MDLSIWGAAGWRPQLDGRPHLARRQRCNSQRQLLLGVRAAFESYCNTLHAAGTERALHQLGVVKTRLGKLARESRFASASGNGTNGFFAQTSVAGRRSAQSLPSYGPKWRRWVRRRSAWTRRITPQRRSWRSCTAPRPSPQKTVLWRPPNQRAQVAALPPGRICLSRRCKTIMNGTAWSRSFGPPRKTSSCCRCATNTACPCGTVQSHRAHTFTLAQRTECAFTPLTRARIAHLVAVGARARPAPLVGDCRAASRSGGQAVPRTVPALAV